MSAQPGTQPRPAPSEPGSRRGPDPVPRPGPTAEDVAKALQAKALYVVGRGWPEIADEVGYTSAADAQQAVVTLVATTEAAVGPGRRVFNTHIAEVRLNALYEAHHEKALSGNPESTKLVLKIIQMMKP